jgi:hypothetical protein
MKVIDQALKIMDSLPQDESMRQVASLLKDAKRKAEKLEEALGYALDLLCNDIRYKTWPTIGLGIDLKAETMDVVIAEGESALRSSQRGRNPKKI